MTRRIIGLGWGKTCTLGTYVRAWKQAKTLPPDMPVKTVPGRFDGGTISDLLTAMREGMHDRINRHDPAYGRGRKWSCDWQGNAWRFSREVNEPRRVMLWIPPDFRARFAHRINQGRD